MRKTLNKIGKFIALICFLISISNLFKSNFGFVIYPNDPNWPAKNAHILIFYVVGIWFIFHAVKIYKKNKESKNIKDNITK